MVELRITLTSDGSSDAALLPVLRWLLRCCGVIIPINDKWVDHRWLNKPPDTLIDRVRVAVALEPCDILFVHRDSEGQAPEDRRREILDAVSVAIPEGTPPAVCVIPVRMTEAWMLIDEMAIRTAADNPRGRTPIHLPPLRRLEADADPKYTLHRALKTASELSGRRLSSFNPHQRVHRVAQLIDNFEPLRKLSAFQQLERDVTIALTELAVIENSPS